MLRETIRPTERADSFSAPYATDDAQLLDHLILCTRRAPEAERRIDERAQRLIETIRQASGQIGGWDDFLSEYGLSTKEGLALMVLAEALLRVPDATTQDKLIEDKLAAGRWNDQTVRSDTWFVSASTWGLGLSARVVQPNETPETVVGRLIKQIGLPAVRTATRRAMRLLGHNFVLGETIDQALRRAAPFRTKGYRHSFDMLGEGARTWADAERYREAYAKAIETIGRSAGQGLLPDRPGISVKLSALHPRYEPLQGTHVLDELSARVLALAQQAKGHALNFTIDAEEADRLELSLQVVERVLSDSSLIGWNGFGLAVQAYQKRALDVVDWICDLAELHGRSVMVRLVKGAYWDTEIKRAQEDGLADYPVFTRKAATDLSFLACAQRLLDARPRVFPQFASHNALTIATILEMSGDREGFEFQCLHGMGEALYRAVAEQEQVPCRIYAPVGHHRDLLAYLVRRLLENGANSSFVSLIRDRSIPIAKLLERPEKSLVGSDEVRHSNIPLPARLYGAERRNSQGLAYGSHAEVNELLESMARTQFPLETVGPLVAGARPMVEPQEVRSPIDGETLIGRVIFAEAEIADHAMANAARAHPSWAATPVETRAGALERLADLLEAERPRLMALLAVEAGKTLDDGLAEVREAVDFCRYYAGEARRLFGGDTLLPGPTGEENRYRLRSRGVFVCISPWNFPLAIFLGQVTAALAAGNTVVAKPAEQTCLVASEAVRLLHRAGVPKDVVQLVLGSGGTIGTRLVRHRQAAGVAFTGSTETAWRINRELASKESAIVPFIAETGGINAMIVDATALPEQVTDDVVTSAFRSAGQRCSALRLLLLQDDIADGVLEMIEGAAKALVVGDPRDPSTDIGPVIDAAAQSKLKRHIADMKTGQELRFSGRLSKPRLETGHYVAPHVVILKDAESLEREVFGPILHVVRWKASQLDSVLASIAAKGYGLTLGIHSRIDSTVNRIVDRLAIGNIYVNRNTIGAVVGTQPFGGSGLSGTGPKAGGPNYLLRFAQEQVVTVNTAAAGGNASLIAMDTS